MAENNKNLFKSIKEFFVKFFSEVNNVIYTCLIVGVIVILAIVCLITSLAPDRNRLQYHLMDDGTYEVVDIKSTYRGGIFLRETITVPSEYKGVPVTKITKINSKHIEKITLSEGIKKIEVNAFANAASLKEINLPNSLEYIGDNAFNACQELDYIYIPKGVKYVGNAVAKSCPSIIFYFEGEKGLTAEWGANWNASATIQTTGNEEIFDNFRPTHYNVKVGDFFEYEGNDYLVDNGNATLVSWNTKTSDIAIPKTVKNREKSYNVSKIGNYSLSGLTGVEEIKISTISELDDNAFSGCKDLLRIYLGNNVDKVGSDCFGKCDQLLVYCEKKLADTTTWAEGWNSSRPVYYNIKSNGYAFTNGFEYFVSESDNVTVVLYRLDDAKVVVPEKLDNKTVTVIEKTCFVGKNKITSVELPDTLTTIAGGAFANCRALKNIFIPISVLNIGAGVFENCTDLVIYTESQTFNYDENWNSGRPYHYTSNKSNIVVVDNLEFLITDAGNAILTKVRGNDKKIEIPNNVKINKNDYNVVEIASYAFENKAKLVEVNVGDNITKISPFGFVKCSSIKQMFLPDSVAVIDGGFVDCADLVIYASGNVSSNDVSNPVYNNVDKEKVVTVGNAEYLINGTNATLTIFRGKSEFVVVDNKIKVEENEYNVVAFGKNSFVFAKKIGALCFMGVKAEWDAIDTTLANFANEDMVVAYYSEEKPEDNNSNPDYFWHYDENNKPVVWKK